MPFESTTQTNIINYLTKKGAYVINMHGDEYNRGRPDILACYEGLWVAFEAKQPNGSLTNIQRLNLRMIQKAGGIAEAVRTLAAVITIIETIDRGEKWINGSYPHVPRRAKHHTRW